jgi:hypothetical protein
LPVRPAGTRFLSRFASAWLLLESRRAPIGERQDPMIFPFGNTKVCHYYFSRSERFAHAEANGEQRMANGGRRTDHSPFANRYRAKSVRGARVRAML